MSDLAVKLFMVAARIDDPEVARHVMYNFGLAEPFVDFANRLQFAIASDDDDYQEGYTHGFTDGIEFLKTLLDNAHPASMKSPNYAEGFTDALDAVRQVAHFAHEGAKETEGEPTTR